MEHDIIAAMAADELFPVDLNTKPSCGLTWQWKRDNPDGTRTEQYAGADGYLYQKLDGGSKTTWRKVGKS